MKRPRLQLPDAVTVWLSPTGGKEPRWRKLLRRLTCAIEDHPTASMYPHTNIFVCDWCGASWKQKGYHV